MQVFFAFILAFFLMACPQNSWAEKVYHVVVFGDGITSGYQLQPQDAFPAQLEKKIRQAGYDQVKVFSLGDSSWTSAEATTHLQEVIDALPDVIIIQFGYNDSKRGVVAEATRSNLNIIVNGLKKTNAYIILAGTPAPEGVADSYRQAVEGNYYDIAGAAAVPLVPNILEGVANYPTMTMADGRHPNTVGVETMVENVFPFVDTGLRWRYDVYLHEINEERKTKPPGLPDIK